jgi:hypothetical protein
VAALRARGGDSHESEKGMRVSLGEGEGPDVVFRLARDTGAQVRYLRPAGETLEDVFLTALGHPVEQH